MTALDFHYSNTIEGDRLFSSRANSLEFHTTCRFIEKFIKPECKIIELGAGHGVYSCYFSRLGHKVLATDIVRENVLAIGKLIEAEQTENLQCRELDAKDMETIGDNQFDATLCLGPLYHLRNRADRDRSIGEAVRITKTGGIIAFAYINRVFALAYMQSLGIVFGKDDYQAMESEAWENHRFPDDFMNISYFSTPEIMEEELSCHDIALLSHVAADGPYTMFKKRVEEMGEEEFSDLRQFHFHMAELPSSLGASCHNLVICRKRG